MRLEINIVDAFTDTVFKGNSAAVILLESWLPDILMQAIATQNNLSETAFLVLDKAGLYHIRWFSPICEIDFCGHATLASAFILFDKNPETTYVRLFAKAVGELFIQKSYAGLMQMDFPNTKPILCNGIDIPTSLLVGLSIEPQEVYRNAQAYFVIYQSEFELLSVKRNNELLKQLAPLDVVVTCQPEKSGRFGGYDFMSRYFWPANGGDEDPVTGSIHTGLAPLWAERLGKTELQAYQASRRGGVLHCEVKGSRVLISGSAIKYLTGYITVPFSLLTTK